MISYRLYNTVAPRVSVSVESDRFHLVMVTSDVADSKRVSDLFTQVVARSKALVHGFLSVEDKTDAAAVQLVWSKTDLVNKVTHKYQVQHHVWDVTRKQPKVLVTGFPTNWTDEYTSVSPSSKRVVTLNLERKNGHETPEGVWNGTMFTS